MKKVVLTGGIGSGKSTVAKIFESFGVPVFYADQVAKAQYFEPNVILKLSQEVTAPIIIEGKVDLSYLKSHLFTNPILKKQVEAVIHPAVADQYRLFCDRNQSASYTINEMALVFENNRQEDFDYIISVIADEEMRIERVIRRDQMSRQEILDRIALQTSDHIRLSQSSFIIYNNNLTELYGQIEKIHKFLQFSQ
ncbi:dephospho-CoA kinase [Flavobacterium sp.]|uniref:dephospho-CoA kinase n=1 Tax=Flavobacterium sp. TaxID=239 RepID=UPI003B9BD0B5